MTLNSSSLVKCEKERRFSEQRGPSVWWFLAGRPDVFMPVVTVVFGPELGLEQPHHLGNTARRMPCEIPGVGTESCLRSLRMEVRALDEPVCLLSQRILWALRAEMLKGVDFGIDWQSASSTASTSLELHKNVDSELGVPGYASHLTEVR